MPTFDNVCCFALCDVKSDTTACSRSLQGALEGKEHTGPYCEQIDPNCLHSAAVSSIYSLPVPVLS